MTLDTILLFSLPASGKSEVRTYLGSLSPEVCRRNFDLGSTLQLADHPYVHLMHRLDEELQARGWPTIFYRGPNRPFQDDWTWAMLIELLNEDYANLRAGRTASPSSAAQHLMDRLDAARAKVGLSEALGDVPHRIRVGVATALEAEARHELDLLNRTCGTNPEGHTIILEAARGGPNGAAFPLTPPQGYWSAFQQLSHTILERAAIFYIWVDPAESRRKNIARGLPDAQGSILNHSVPMEVMLAQYGCDDMAWLLEQSDRPGSVRVERVLEEGGAYRSRVFHLPTARFDNRLDRTSFVRKPSSQWLPEEREALHKGLQEAFLSLRSTP